MSRKSRRSRDDEARKPIAKRAADLADWLEDVENSAGIIRAVRFWWNRNKIVDVALEALDALVDLEKKDGMHDRIRRSLAIAVTALGGPRIDWEKQAAKTD